MKKVSEFIVNHRKIFMIVFLAVTFAAAILSAGVKINYDQSVYLPEDSDTFQGLKIMEEDFGVTGSMSVMVKDVSLVEASELRKEIDDVENVDSALFLDVMLLSMKTDDEQTDDEYIDSMFDMLNMVYKMQADYFPDRSLGYVFQKMLDMSDELGNALPKLPTFATDNGVIAGGELAGILAEFDDGGQSESEIDASSLDMLEGYYKQKNALLSITFKYGDFAAETFDAIEEILDTVPSYGEAHYTGQAANAYFNQKDSGREMIIIAAFAAVIIMLILFLTTSSYVEPLLYAIVIVSAILLNMGTNLIFGTISSMSNMVAALLQLALSMDYSIFLLHSYAAEKKTAPDRVSAMKTALAKSLSPVSASSLTTIAGFVALMFMTFRIGFDFGMVLSKGIIFSLLSVFLLMPGLTLGLDKALEKTKHKSLIEFFKGVGEKRRARKNASAAADADAKVGSVTAVAAADAKIGSVTVAAGFAQSTDTDSAKGGSVTAAAGSAQSMDADAKVGSVPAAAGSAQSTDADAKVGSATGGKERTKAKGPPVLHRYSDFLFKIKSFVPIFFIILMIPMYFFQAGNDFFFGEFPEGAVTSTYLRDTAEIDDVFGRQNTGVILLSNDLLDKEEELCESLEDFSFVKSVTSYSLLTETMDEDDIPAEMTDQFRGNNYSRVIVTFDFPDESHISFDGIERVEELLVKVLGKDSDYILMGTTKSVYEIKDYSLSDSNLISLLTLLFILVILGFTFKSVGIVMILGLIIQGATWINMAVPYLSGQLMSFIGYIIISGIQMGATIDYGILLTNNYMAERRTLGRKEAMRNALSKSFSAILVSGSILTVVGLSLGVVSTNISTIMLGMALGRGAFISTVCMIFVLPQALMLLDKFVRGTTVGGRKDMIDEKAAAKIPKQSGELAEIPIGNAAVPAEIPKQNGEPAKIPIGNAAAPAKIPKIICLSAPTKKGE
ncbi:MAG: MMPL family transporter [Clostridiales bacterium]|nr:MMPL family transporter [Clostridiales bacterium]